jgi:hypothetical protein
MVTVAHGGLRPGQCDDFGVIREYLEGFGQFGKNPNGKGWVILGEVYDTIAPFKARVYEDPVFGAKVRKMIIARVVDGELMEEGGSANG